jgi:hypothetical protein
LDRGRVCTDRWRERVHRATARRRGT